jgi:hypothetical protein
MVPVSARHKTSLPEYIKRFNWIADYQTDVRRQMLEFNELMGEHTPGRSARLPGVCRGMAEVLGSSFVIVHRIKKRVISNT